MSMMQRHGGWPVMQDGAAYGTEAAMSSSGLDPEYHVTYGKERPKENHKVSTVIHSPFYSGFDLCRSALKVIRFESTGAIILLAGVTDQRQAFSVWIPHHVVGDELGTRVLYVHFYLWV
ncbi:MAG: hypothetical protein Q9180_000194 [Flavoplaca navasiana]